MTRVTIHTASVRPAVIEPSFTRHATGGMATRHATRDARRCGGAMLASIHEDGTARCHGTRNGRRRTDNAERAEPNARLASGAHQRDDRLDPRRRVQPRRRAKGERTFADAPVSEAAGPLIRPTRPSYVSNHAQRRRGIGASGTNGMRSLARSSASHPLGYLRGRMSARSAIARVRARHEAAATSAGQGEYFEDVLYHDHPSVFRSTSDVRCSLLP
jgi:hypothetical protein